MRGDGSRVLDVVAATGLGLGGVFGIAGTLVTSAPLLQTFWAVDGIGIVVATALLAVRFLRDGNACVAAGFIVFVVGESLLLSGTPAGLVGSVPSFGAGVALWATSLLMTSIPKAFPRGSVLWVVWLLCRSSSPQPGFSGGSNSCRRRRHFRRWATLSLSSPFPDGLGRC